MRTFTADQVAQLINNARALDDAGLIDQAQNRPGEFQVIVLPLDVARAKTDPYIIGSPFRALYVAEATDSSVVVQFRPITAEEHQGAIPLRAESNVDNGRRIPKGYLHWDAQAGKSITLVLSLNATIKSGRIVSVQSGGVSISEGDTITTAAKVTLTAATATLISAADSTAKNRRIENQGAVAMYLGGVNVTRPGGANPGFKVDAGSAYDLHSTAAIYGISDDAVEVSVTKFN